MTACNPHLRPLEAAMTDNTARYVFFLPQSGPVYPRAIDEALPAEAGGHVGRFSGKTHDELRAQYGAELDVMELDAFTIMAEDAMRTA